MTDKDYIYCPRCMHRVKYEPCNHGCDESPRDRECDECGEVFVFWNSIVVTCHTAFKEPQDPTIVEVPPCNPPPQEPAC